MKAERKKELLRSLKFLLFSVSAGIIQIVTFTLLNELLHLPYWASYLVALILSVVWNFTLNRRFTFRAANNVPVAMLKVAAYYAVFTPLSTLLEKYLTGWLRPGDVVILSPACSSFDRFKNFVERGNTFRQIVEQIE